MIFITPLSQENDYQSCKPKTRLSDILCNKYSFSLGKLKNFLIYKYTDFFVVTYIKFLESVSNWSNKSVSQPLSWPFRSNRVNSSRNLRSTTRSQHPPSPYRTQWFTVTCKHSNWPWYNILDIDYHHTPTWPSPSVTFLDNPLVSSSLFRDVYHRSYLYLSSLVYSLWDVFGLGIRNP